MLSQVVLCALALSAQVILGSNADRNHLDNAPSCYNAREKCTLPLPGCTHLVAVARGRRLAVAIARGRVWAAVKGSGQRIWLLRARLQHHLRLLAGCHILHRLDMQNCWA